MNAADRAAIAKWHVMTRTWDSWSPEAVDGWITWCAGCGKRPWPCDAARLLAALTEAEENLERLHRELQRGEEGPFG